jgi:hypothetical protein
MVCTLLTSRVGTIRVPPSQLALPSPIIKEEHPEEQHHLVEEDGRIMEDNSEEVLVTPT